MSSFSTDGPVLSSPSIFSQDISRAILASNQLPKSTHAASSPLSVPEYPPTPPPSPVASKSTPSFWGMEHRTA